MTVRTLKERRCDPPQPIEVERDGTWFPGWLRAWRLLDDGQGWRADVQYAVPYDWGLGCHVGTVLAARVRPVAARPPTTQLAVVLGNDDAEAASREAT